MQRLVEVPAAGRVDRDQVQVAGVTPSRSRRAVEPRQHRASGLLSLGDGFGPVRAGHVELLADAVQSGLQCGPRRTALEGLVRHGGGRYRGVSCPPD